MPAFFSFFRHAFLDLRDAFLQERSPEKQFFYWILIPAIAGELLLYLIYGAVRAIPFYFKNYLYLILMQFHVALAVYMYFALRNLFRSLKKFEDYLLGFAGMLCSASLFGFGFIAAVLSVTMIPKLAAGETDCIRLTVATALTALGFGIGMTVFTVKHSLSAKRPPS